MRNLIAILFGLFAFGCVHSAVGPHFTDVPLRPSEAILYVYRPHQRTLSYYPASIQVGNKSKTDLWNAGFLRYELKPGKYNISVKGHHFEMPDATVALDATANHKYFLKYDMGGDARGYGIAVGAAVGGVVGAAVAGGSAESGTKTHFYFVSIENALPEIKETKESTPEPAE